MYVDQHTKRQVCIKMRKFVMFITAVCVLFLLKPLFHSENKRSDYSALTNDKRVFFTIILPTSLVRR